mgnify:CR=1 FL=1
MRLRNVKGSREQIAANEYTIKDAEQIKGQWKDYFQDGKPIQLEIGMGKGKFLMRLAEKILIFIILELKSIPVF